VAVSYLITTLERQLISPSSAQAPKESLSESKSLMIGILPSPENPDIDKYAILLRPVEENPQPWVNGKGKPKMIGLTGTNRWSYEGMETGYFMNIAYWGKGYAGEAFTGFLEMFWNLPRKSVSLILFRDCNATLRR